MSLLETIRQVVVPGASYPLVTLFPGGPIGNDVGLTPGAMPGGGAVPEPQVAEPENGKSKLETGQALPTPTGGLVQEPQTEGTGNREQGIDKSQIIRLGGKSQIDTYLRGAVGTANFAGFIRDLGEYNPTLEGRTAFLTYEKMRRSDADVRAALLACKLPIRAADYQIVPGVKENEQGFEFAKEIADFVRENLLGGLESPTSTGCWVTQNFETVKENALLCLDFGCAAHEDLWHIDGDRVRLRKLAPRLPYTFYRYHVDNDGETLLYLEQYGYRGNNFVNVLVPAEKIAYFVNDMEGAYFYGRSVLRAAYQHWYMKSQIYRIDAISIERNGLGVPTIRQGPNVSAEDRKSAEQWVKNLAAHENTGLSLPNGWEFALTGITGRIRDPKESIQHHSEMIMRSVLANFLTLGTTQTGSRALGGSMRDFFYLSLESVSDKIDETISNTSIKRLVDYNYTAKPGEKLPYPKLVTSNIVVINPLELLEIAKDVAHSNVDLLQPDDDTENWIRQKTGMPQKAKTARLRYAPIVQRVQLMEEGEMPVEPGEKLEREGAAQGSPPSHQGTKRQKQAEGTGNREQGTGNREQGTGNREQGTESAKQAQASQQSQIANRKSSRVAGSEQSQTIRLGGKSQMPTAYWIRHGHTRFNSPDSDPKHAYLRGMRNVPLDEEGKAEAKEIAASFEGIKLRVIFSSPLDRAMEVALEIADVTGAPVRTLVGLLPRDWGELTGRKVEDVLDQLEELKKDPDKAPEGGESANAWFPKVAKGIEEVLAETEDSRESVVAVTHSSIVEYLPIALIGGDPHGMEMEGRLPPGSIIRAVKEGADWKLSAVGIGERESGDREIGRSGEQKTIPGESVLSAEPSIRRSMVKGLYDDLVSGNSTRVHAHAVVNRLLQKGTDAARDDARLWQLAVHVHKQHGKDETSAHAAIDQAIDADGHWVTIDDQPVFIKNAETLSAGESQITNHKSQMLSTVDCRLSTVVPNRDLKPFEKKHDFAGHVERADITARNVARILRGALPAYVHALAQDASHRHISDIANATAPAPHALTGRIERILSVARRYGHGQVYAERYRATGRGKNDPLKPCEKKTAASEVLAQGANAGIALQETPRGPKKTAWFNAQALISDYQNEVSKRVRARVIDLAKDGLEGDNLAWAAEEDLVKAASGWLDRLGSEAGRAAAAAGRDEAFAELDPEIGSYVRSEVMDRNTCEPCEAGDGQEWASYDEIDWQPGDDCEGGDACRGQIIPVFADEGVVVLE